MPRNRRDLQVELVCEEVEQCDAAVAEARKRSGCAAELRREPLLGDLLESQAGLDDRSQPAGGLEAERRRHRVLQERPGDHGRLAVLARQRGSGGRHVVGLGEHEPERPPGDEHRGRVDDVLARRAPVYMACSLVADGTGERPDEWFGEIADLTSFVHEPFEVEALGVAGAGDLGRHVRRDAACGRAGVRERPLGVEHCFEPCPRRDGGPKFGGDEEALERRHAAIVVVHGATAAMGSRSLSPIVQWRSPSSRARAPPT